MRKIFTLLFLFIAILVSSVSAQCNPEFTFALVSNNGAVQFTPVNNGQVDHQWIFGDGTSSFSATPTHIYNPGSYNVVHVVTAYSPNDSNLIECIDSAVRWITVTGQPDCNFNASFSFVRDSLQTNKIYFNNLTQGLTSSSTVYWNFGDGAASTVTNPVHIFPDSGVFRVCLTVRRDSLCGSDTCATIEISAPSNGCNLAPGFLYFRDSTPTSPYVYSFYNTTTPLTNVDSSFWDFGDGTPVAINPAAPLTHTYTSPGIYTVCLKVKKVQPGTINIICERQYCQTISIDTMQCNLQAYFGYSADSLERNKFTFSNYTAGISSTDTIHWDFGDGSTSNLLNPQHIYNDTGFYRVCMIVKKATLPGTVACVSEYCTTVQTFFGCDLVANFNFYSDSINGGNPLVYHFENTSTSLSSTDSSTWNFGDGTEWSMTSNNSFTYTFARPGTYTVCLQVRNSGTPGTVYFCEDRICRTIVIPNTDSVCNELQVNYSWSPDSADNRKVHFINQTSPLTANTMATWTFGDGTTSTASSPEHVYAQPGNYHVCLIVRMANCIKESCQLVIIPAPPVDSCRVLASFNTSLSATSNRIVLFTNTTLNADSTNYFVWNFGDGTISRTGWNPAHMYIMPGWYLVSLTVRATDSCSSTVYDSVFVPGNVIPPVNCDTFQLQYGYRQDDYMPNKFFFFPASNAPTYSEQWKFIGWGNSSNVTINQSNPVYVFPDTGYYTVCVRAEFSTGCVKEYCDYIRIENTNLPSQCIVNSYPNPAHSNLSFNIQLETPGAINTVIANMQGIVLQQNTQQGVTGNNLVTLNVSTLPTGFYSVKILYNGRVCYTRFQKI